MMDNGKWTGKDLAWAPYVTFGIKAQIQYVFFKDVFQVKAMTYYKPLIGLLLWPFV